MLNCLREQSVLERNSLKETNPLHLQVSAK
jgi:hypothetical protein